MNASMKKTVAGTMAAMTLAFAVFAAAPASAGPMWWGNHQHFGWGPFAAAGVIGLAAGAAIASNNYDCTRYQPVYDRWGNYIGNRPVNVCY
jgi:hypothetical protein